MRNGTNGHTNGQTIDTIDAVQLCQPIIQQPQIIQEARKRDKLRPHSIEAEQALLGSLLIDIDAIAKVSAYLRSDHFYIEKHGMIFQAMLDLFLKDKPVDIVLLADELEERKQLWEVGGSAYLNSLMNVTPSSIWVEEYAKQVVKKHLFRSLIDAAGSIAKVAYSEGDLQQAMDQAEELIFKVTSQLAKDSGPRHIKDGLSRYYERLEYLSQNEGKLVGLPTGLRDLDKLLGGLNRSDVIVLAGRPGMGKTSLGLSIALNAAKVHKKRVALFSLEMSDEQLIQRLVSSETDIDSQRLRLGNLKDEEWPKFYQAIKTLSETSFFIDDTPAISINYLRSKARRLYLEHGLDLLIVDYLQLMTGPGNNRKENRQQEVSDISRGIKSLARELNIPILALSQLSRNVESRSDKRPILADLRESGSIEQDADVVLFIYRDEAYNPDSEFPNIAEIICGKHRSGPTGALSVYFKKHLSQFVDLIVNTQRLEQVVERYNGPRKVGQGLNEWLGQD